MKRKFIILFALLLALASCFSTACGNNGVTLTGDYGATAEGNFENGSKLVVTQIGEISAEQKAKINEKSVFIDGSLIAYDISVKKDDVKVQPDGKVKITLDFSGTSANGYSVYHFLSDGETEVLPATVSGGKLTFETSGFSVFIIGENAPETYEYNITYNLDGGEFNDGVTAPAKYGNDSEFPIVLPAPTKSGYAFKGWKNAYGAEMTEISSKMRGDVTLTAQWEEAEDEEFFLFRLEMDKVDPNDSNIKTLELYSTRVSDGKGEVLRPKFDGSFENRSGAGLRVSIDGGTYIDILSDTVYKNCTAGSRSQEKGNHGYCYYDGSFRGKITVNENYMLFILKKIGNKMERGDRLEAVTTDSFLTLGEGRYFVVRKDAYNRAVADGKKNETGELYEALLYLIEPHDDGNDNPVIEDITACYEIWIQFADSVKPALII